ncbi:MAG: hypothetical protein IT438_16525 [Phycisphaerales bacterium]|nr:hypothetical protein [Phycisphaerales bacterium]
MQRVILVLLFALAGAGVLARPALADELPHRLALPAVASDGPSGPLAEALDAARASWAGNAVMTYTFEVSERSGPLGVHARVAVVDGVLSQFDAECREVEGEIDCPELFPPDWTVPALFERARVGLYQGQLTDFRANVNGLPLAIAFGAHTIEVTAFTTGDDATDLALARARWGTVGVDGYSTTVRFWDPERQIFVLRTAVVEDGTFVTVSAPDAVPAPCAAPGPATPDELFAGIDGLFEVYGTGAVDVAYDLYDGRPVSAQWGPVLDPGGQAEFRVLFFDLLEGSAALGLLAS